jgi:hypothetical protein
MIYVCVVFSVLPFGHKMNKTVAHDYAPEDLSTCACFPVIFALSKKRSRMLNICGFVFCQSSIIWKPLRGYDC